MLRIPLNANTQWNALGWIELMSEFRAAGGQVHAAVLREVIGSWGWGGAGGGGGDRMLVGVRMHLRSGADASCQCRVKSVCFYLPANCTICHRDRRRLGQPRGVLDDRTATIRISYAPSFTIYKICCGSVYLPSVTCNYQCSCLLLLPRISDCLKVGPEIEIS